MKIVRTMTAARFPRGPPAGPGCRAWPAGGRIRGWDGCPLAELTRHSLGQISGPFRYRSAASRREPCRRCTRPRCCFKASLTEEQPAAFSLNISLTLKGHVHENELNRGRNRVPGHHLRLPHSVSQGRERTMKGVVLVGVMATHIAALGAGYVLAYQPPDESEIKESGFFRADTSRILSATVETLRHENKLLVFSFKGSAKVRTDRSYFWLFSGHQELQVPAVVHYYLDLSQLSLGSIRYDEQARLVRVRLPSLTVGDIAFQPERATTINGGVLLFGGEQVEALRKLNYAAARQSMVAQAREAGLVAVAKSRAIANVESCFELPLRVAGLPDVRVIATFK